ncbi:PREDICTED: solute carrier family 43 member 3-like isoform X1 [Branchiostoma belcheri]|uniref:Solute carrier family 43 member 3-like isoform X1 n=1 Tax=Branchiostoma belcheri TaxID=7741 RepID=A0A6P5A3M8_BRABE|nr:PREDICTED: solute carrier family 43 member 3-like isoform X1 [Branchiostoma belcheri]
MSQVPPVKKWTTFVTGVLECLLFGGLIFGWASLVIVLKGEKFFSCPPSVNGQENGFSNSSIGTAATPVIFSNETQFTTVSPTSGSNASDVDSCSAPVSVCTYQDEQLSLVFTIASACLSFMALPNGILYDKFGTRKTRIVASFTYAIAMLMTAFTTVASSEVLFASMCIMAVSGGYLLITNMQIGNLFGDKRSTVITLVNGAFDSSSFVFLVVLKIYEGGVSFKAIFLFYAVAASLLLLRSLFLLPSKQFPWPVPPDYNYGICRGKNTSRRPPGADVELNHNHEAGELQQEALMSNGNAQQNEEEDEEEISTPELYYPTFMKGLKSGMFYTHIFWFSVIQLRNYFFMGTFNPWMTKLAEDNGCVVKSYTEAFALTQLFGVFCAPMNGLIMDTYRKYATKKMMQDKQAGVEPAYTKASLDLRSCVVAFSLTTFLGVLFSVCVVIPVLPIQYLSFILQVVLRSFLYGGNATFFAVGYPPRHFGKMFGADMFIGGVVSCFQYPLFILTQDVFQKNPMPVNIILLVLTALTVIHPVYLYFHCKWLDRQYQENGPQTVKKRRQMEDENLLVVDQVSTI